MELPVIAHSQKGPRLLRSSFLIVSTLWFSVGWSTESLHYGESKPFSYEILIERAQELSKFPYSPPSRLNASIADQLGYETWQNLRYRPEAAVLADGANLFPATFFHVGRLFPSSIKMHVIDGSSEKELLYDPNYFSMPDDSVARTLPNDTGFAGLRIHDGIDQADWSSHTWLSFLGASYFRAIGEQEPYGASALGAAVFSENGGSEEFPIFKEFFLQGAKKSTDPIVTYALLEGPSLVGAFRFSSTRASGVTQDIDAVLYVRKSEALLGFAPLTTMFWFSETQKRRLEDWRPEVHDSDGLAIWSATGERLWRPLINPSQMSRTSFEHLPPKGFGFLQRDRNPDHYQDDAHYELRPSVWVELLDGWKEGRLELVELPTDDEQHDNVSVFWKPETPIKDGDTIHLRYRLHWANAAPFPSQLARCVATRIGQEGWDGSRRQAEIYRFSVEFEGDVLARFGPNEAGASPDIKAVHATVEEAIVERVPGTKRWRVVFDVKLHDKEPADLRLAIRTKAGVVTETWTYRFKPD